MYKESLNPHTLITTTDDNKPRVKILRDDEPDREAQSGGVKLSGTPATEEQEEQALHEENGWGL